MKDHVTPVSACTNCGQTLDRATNAAPGEESEPKPGAITVCIGCQHVMIYADDMSLRDPTEDELIEIAADPDLLRAMRLIAEFKRSMP